MWLANFHFIRPEWLLGLLPLAFILWRMSCASHEATNWRNVCDPHLLSQLITSQQTSRSRTPLILLTLGWILTILALAGPSWSRESQPVYRSGSSQMIVLDLSSAMNAADITPNRITRAKYKVIDILKRNQEGQIGMLAFAGEPYVVSPLTQDAETISALIPELRPEIMPSDGQNIAAALKKAGELLQQTGVVQGSILLITCNTANSDSINEATRLRSKGILTSVLAIGTQDGAPVPSNTGGFVHDDNGSLSLSKMDYSSLEKLARAGGGSFTPFTNDSRDIDILLATATAQAAQSQAHVTDNSATLWHDQGHWFILLLLPLALLAFRRGWLEAL